MNLNPHTCESMSFRKMNREDLLASREIELK